LNDKDFRGGPFWAHSSGFLIPLVCFDREQLVFFTRQKVNSSLRGRWRNREKMLKKATTYIQIGKWNRRGAWILAPKLQGLRIKELGLSLGMKTPGNGQCFPGDLLRLTRGGQVQVIGQECKKKMTQTELYNMNIFVHREKTSRGDVSLLMFCQHLYLGL
jgi:hypothetical protein